MNTRLLAGPFMVATLSLCASACDKPAPASEEGGAASKRAEAGAEAPASETAKAPPVGEAERAPVEAKQPGKEVKDVKTRMAEAKAEAKTKGDELKRSRAKLSQLLNDGRAAVKDKRYDEGIALYRKALEIDPVNAKVLGELGFAALRKGDLELAEAMTRRAIDLSPSTKGLGATYYNLGRIEEERGKIAEARAAYERSLAVRPGNEIVAGRLAALAPPKAGQSVTSLDPLCADLMAEWSCYASEAEIEKLPEDEQMDAGLCTCTVDKQLSEGTGKSFISDAALLYLEGSGGYGGYMEDKYLVVKTRGQGWQHVGNVVNGYTPGAFGIFNEGEVESFEFVELAGAPGEELRVTSFNAGTDTDMGINLMHYDHAEDMVVCYDAGGGLGRCGSIPVSRRAGTDILMEDEPIDDPSDIGEISWAFELNFDGGKLEIKVKSGQQDLEIPEADLVGSRSVEDTLILDGIEQTMLH